MGYGVPHEIKLKKQSIFDESMNTGLRYLMSINVDRLLAPCFEMHNLAAPNNAIRYAGWERKNANNWEESTDNYTLAGHSLGHFLSAAAEFYNDSQNELVLNKLNYILNKLDELQEKSGSAYIGGCPEETFLKAFSGDKKWHEGYWVPWYGIHKIYQGLINAYRYTKNEVAMKVLKKFADWAVEGTNHLSDEQMQEMLEVEYGGMNEVFADMYELTKDERYLKCARRFTQDSLIIPLSKGEDVLSKVHANTQIPKVVGAAALYDQDKEKYAFCGYASDFFWNNVVGYRSYVIGGNSIGEHFETIEEESLGKKTCESCNTYNMLRLTERMFTWKQDSKYMDYYEAALYNHILGQQEPKTGAKQYFVSLLQGHHRVYEMKEESWWCCTGTGMENPGKYKRCIFFEKGDSMFINLYMPVEEYIWKNKNLKIRIDTEYPCDGRVKLVVLSGSAAANFRFRAPAWISKKMKLKYHGKTKESSGGEYVEVSGSWSAGDEIIIDIPLEVRTYTSRAKDKIVFEYGPFALAALLEKVTEASKAIEYIFNETIIDDEVVKVPSIVALDKDLCSIVRLVDKAKMEFEISGEYLSSGKNVRLKPFYSVHHYFHTVYWDVNK